jgi:hypothetical protein
MIRSNTVLVVLTFLTVAAVAWRTGPEPTCREKAGSVCRHDGPIVRWSSHVKCLIRESHRFPDPACVGDVELWTPCVDDMAHFCPDMTEAQTLRCLGDHHDQLSEECVSSIYMREIHEQDGRDVKKYLAAYHDEGDRIRNAVERASSREKEAELEDFAEGEL